MVSARGLRGDQLHEELVVRGIRGIGFLGGRVSFDDVFAPASGRRRTDRQTRMNHAESPPSRGAGKQRGYFDNGVGELSHSTEENFDETRIELRAGAALEFAERLLGGAAFLITA